MTRWTCPRCGISAEMLRDLPVRCGCENRPPTVGPGAELTRLLQSLGINEINGCNCRAIAQEMNILGPAGCREQRDRLIGILIVNAEQYGWQAKLLAGIKAIWSGAPLSIGSLFDEAVRRSEEPISQ